MDKTKNIINYYLYVNKLKYKLREGFVQIGITKDRLERAYLWVPYAIYCNR